MAHGRVSRVAVLTGRERGKERNEIFEQLAGGEIDVARFCGASSSNQTVHADAHSVVLPHAVAFNAPALPDEMEALAQALGGEPATALWSLATECGVPTSLAALGLGLLSSTLSDTQQQAMMTTTFFFMLPMIYLSGFIFPIENMPAVIQYVTYLIPLRYFLVIVRGIFLKGVGWDVLWPQFVALTTWGLVVITLAAARTRKRA